ncbi:MAG TPA: hypothetical protein V6D43_03340 [Candidatus Sericytochromatia bacterium]
MLFFRSPFLPSLLEGLGLCSSAIALNFVKFAVLPNSDFVPKKEKSLSRP